MKPRLRLALSAGLYALATSGAALARLFTRAWASKSLVPLSVLLAASAYVFWNPAASVTAPALVYLPLPFLLWIVMRLSLERERVQERLRSAEERLAKQRSEITHLSRVAMLGELSGSLAHELNQPLAAILANAQAAQRFLACKPASLDEIHDILKDIVEDDKRAGEVIRRLRVLFKKEEMQHQSVDVNEVVQAAMQLMRTELMKRGVSVLSRLAPGLPRVKADRVHLQQVLVNLMMNGADAMEGMEHEGRSLTLQTTLVAAGAVEIDVIDQGKGIPAADIERIFDPFVTTKPHGMGLGLAVSRTIMLAHRGSLWAANNPGRGTTFCLTLLPLRSDGSTPPVCSAFSDRAAHQDAGALQMGAAYEASDAQCSAVQAGPAASAPRRRFTSKINNVTLEVSAMK